ncbi:MAG: mandelate racemase/muconate lactonizing enzyme family protein [Acidobacteria bacterium]|nr:mandelate racemase/muconate lactonizing enzyme family protein [Acidobacteriota bacterium]MDA1234864.1 mandelate racemase/muconate lactonizing enzyme family protein [Acidobacteriota bacterium]
MSQLDRRHFLTAAGAGVALAGCSAESAAVDPQNQASGPSIEALDAAAAQPVLDVSGIDHPLIIDSIRLLEKDGERFIHVRSKDGAEGLSLTNGREYVSQMLAETIFPFVIGKDARTWETEMLWDLYRDGSNYKLQGLAFWTAQAWVEFAILDMLGRVAGKSIGEMMGGVIRDEIDFYVASGRRDTTPEEEVEYLQSLLDETQAKAVKFRLGGRMSRNADALPGRSEGLIRLARKTFGDAIDLHGDANSSYDPEHAIPIGRVLEEVNAVYFEEPCPFDHLEDTKVVKDALTIPVSGGEQEFSERRFRWMIANRGVDIVQPDLQYYGGLIRSARVANMAELAGMPTTVHISSGFGFVYMLHFASRTKSIGRYQEYKRSIEVYGDWFEPNLTISDGRMSVPKGPGVGIGDIAAVIRGAKQVA